MHTSLRLTSRSAYIVQSAFPSLAITGLAQPSRCAQLASLHRAHFTLPASCAISVGSSARFLRTGYQGVCYPAHIWRARSSTLRASFSGLLLAVSAAVVALSVYYVARPERTSRQDTQELSELVDMAAEIPPGRPGNLTPEQEEKLRRLWQLIFQVCGVGQEQNDAGADSASAVAGDKADGDAKKAKKSRMSFFSRKDKKESEANSNSAPANAPVVLNLGKDGEADKYGQTKDFYETLASQSPESIRNTIWSMVKHDHPDALILRFLRARKWDVDRALIMFVSTMKWRAHEMKVDEDIMKNGEAAALAAEKSSDAAVQKVAHDFMTQLRKGISYVHGTDKLGRPLCFVNVRLHRQGEQEEAAMERYTVYLIETCRMLLQPPVDTATVVFDMTGFSMANMDYSPVKFMIKCFEANYPECLGAVLVHKAPWIFQGIWKVIRGWLDPVVANKVHFTNSAKEMEEFISLKQIPKDLDGEEDWTYQYVEPAEGENDKLNDTQTRDRMLAAREELYKAYEDATLEWIQNPEGDKATEIKARRNSIAAKLRDDYWNLDPYIRARSYYDRTGFLQPGGKLNWYPEGKIETANGVNAASAAAPAAAPVSAIVTSPDDID